MAAISLGKSFGKTLHGELIHIDSLSNLAWIDEKSVISCEKQHRSCSPALLLRWLSRYTKEGETDKEELCPMCCILGMKRARSNDFDHDTMFLIVEMIFRDEHIDTLQKWIEDPELGGICDEVARSLGKMDTKDFIRGILRLRALQVSISMARTGLETMVSVMPFDKFLWINLPSKWRYELSWYVHEGRDVMNFDLYAENAKEENNAPKPTRLKRYHKKFFYCEIYETIEVIREILTTLLKEERTDFEVQLGEAVDREEVNIKAYEQSPFWRHHLTTNYVGLYGLIATECFVKFPVDMYEDLSNRSDPLFVGLQ